MFNWKKLCADTAAYHELREELEGCGGRYILDKVRMPPTCAGKICTIEFRYYGEERVKLICANAPIAYGGCNKNIARWLEKGVVKFVSFEQLESFLRSFNEDTLSGSKAPERARSRKMSRASAKAAAVPKRPELIYDKESIIVPDSSSSFILIDKEKLLAQIGSEIFGQDENIRKIVHIVRNHLGTKKRDRPVSIFLYGPPGTGKSKVAEVLTEKINQQLCERDRFFYRPVDCTQFQEKADISRLTGAAPGYVGFDEPSVFSVLEDHPNTVFVFEEIEKAAPNVCEVIMQAMETGRQETNGKTLSSGASYYDLSHSIIFFTSNISIDENKHVGFGRADRHPSPEKPPVPSANIARAISQETRQAKEKLAENGKFRREVISRMEAVIGFGKLSSDAVKDIAAKSIRDAAEMHRLFVTRIETPILQEFINATAGVTESFGARELRREAANFFGDTFMEYSHTHADHSRIAVSGSLDKVEVLEG